MNNYEGVFSKLLSDFIVFKQSQGFKYKYESDTLSDFSKFSIKFKMEKPIITKKIVDEWMKDSTSEGFKTNWRRVSPLRKFAEYLLALGYETYVPHIEPSIHSNFIPYIFTHSEINRIFSSCDNICQHPLSNMYLIMPVILRLMYGCGLRRSEAVNLQNKHVNLLERTIYIKNSKNGKDRLLPISDSLHNIFTKYYSLMHGSSSGEDYFFMNNYRKQIKADNIYRRFRAVLWESGISHGGLGIGPRLHDLRHTFAVHSLKKMIDKKIDVYCALPYLSTYLGHESIEATSKYVRMTADAFPEIKKILDEKCAHIIPEVNM